MITRIGFVLCEITGEYDDTTVTPIAYSDNSFELEQEIVRLNSIVEEKQKSYDCLLTEATNLIFDLNSKLDLALVDYDKELKFEEELPKPEKWPPQTKQEQKEWSEVKKLNSEISRRNKELREEKKNSVINEFRRNNVIPDSLKEMVRNDLWGNYKYEIRERPGILNLEIRNLQDEDFKISSFDVAL